MKVQVLVFAILIMAMSACKQANFKKVNEKSTLEYKILKNGSGRKAEVGDMLMITVLTKVGDSVLYDSKKLNDNKPVTASVQAHQFNGDVMEGFTLLKNGSHVVFRAPVDSVMRNPQQRPPFIKSGDWIEFDVEVNSLMTQEEFKKDQEKKAEEQVGVDAKLLSDYIAKNNYPAQKTASGLYYQILEEGTGDAIGVGKEVKVNYTGQLLDGSVFDSNEDEKFGHKEPFTLVVGQGSVIKGWDEGLSLMKKGSKARLFIPSGLAYGQNPRPGGPQNPKGIPANSCLVFDIQVLDVKNAPATSQQPQIQIQPQAQAQPEKK